MKEIYNNIIGSFDNEQKGFSSKKLTAFALTIVVVAIHIKWIALGDFSQLEMVLTIDYAFIASLFGMTTYQSMNAKSKSTTAVIDTTSDDTKTIVTNDAVEVTNPPATDTTNKQ